MEPLKVQYNALVQKVQNAATNPAEFKKASDELQAFFKQNPDFDPTKIEKAPDQPLSPEDKALRTMSNDQQIQLANATKELAKLKGERQAETDPAKQAELDKQIAAKQTEVDNLYRPRFVQGNGLDAPSVKVDTNPNFEKGTMHAVADLQAPTEHKDKQTKLESKAELARFYDKDKGEWIETKLTGDEAADNAAMKETRHELKMKKKELKSEMKELEKGSEEYFEKEREYQAAKQAHRAAKGMGTGKARRANNANIKANNRMADRQVFLSQEEADKAIESGKVDKKNAEVLSEKESKVLDALANRAENALKNGANLDENTKAMWEALLPLKDPKVKADAKAVQDILADITGGDFQLDYSEQRMLKKETGMDISDIRHAFKAYGFDAPNPTTKRITNGLIAAGTTLAGYMLANKLASHRATAVADAKAEATATAVAEGANTTTTTVITSGTPGSGFSQDNELGGTREGRTGGTGPQISTNTTVEIIKNVATSTVTSQVLAKATTIARLNPWLGPILAAGAGIMAAAKAPVENSAVKNGATPDKMVEMLNVYKGNGNKNIANQIQQMIGQITGDPGVDKAIVIGLLKQNRGEQNEITTTRELRAVLDQLNDLKQSADKITVDVKPEKPTPPVPPKPEACFDTQEGEVVKPNSYTVEKYDTVDTIIKAKYPDADFKTAKKAFLEANSDLKDPNSIKVGQEFVLPDLPDGTKPTVDGEVRKVIGGKRISFRPSDIRGPQGQQTWDVVDCSDPKNPKVVSKGHKTQDAAQNEAIRRYQEATKK